MVERIIDGLYRITVTLPRNPLKELNSYYIEGIDEDYLVDTGFNLPECEADLTEGLKKINADRNRISILNTHMHTDHTGQNHIYMSEGHHIYMTAPDIVYVERSFSGAKSPRTARDIIEGAPKGFFEKNEKLNPLKIYKPTDIRGFLVPMEDGEIFHARYFDFQAVMTPGHTLGNCMFWIEKEGIMLTGDHILFDITPNITACPDYDDILGTYINNLKRSREFPVKLALPGHRESGDYHKRIDAIILHHSERMEEIMNLIGNSEKPLTAYELTYRMKWSVHRDPDGSIPNAQLWFAAGECEAHLDRLLAENRIERIDVHDDVPFWTYRLK